MTHKILVVDDEQDIVALVRYNLVKDGFQVHCAYDAKMALTLLWQEMPDLVVLDLMLPDVSGVRLCRQMKEEWRNHFKTQLDQGLAKPLRVLMLTARTAEEDRVSGFESGADDYVTKPFSPRELSLRIRAILDRDGDRGTRQEGSAVLTVGDRLRLDQKAHQASLDGETLHLTPIEYRILQSLMRQPGVVKRREQLLLEVWQEASDQVMDRTVDANVKRLRAKLGDVRDSLETVRGVGYRLNPEVILETRP